MNEADVTSSEASVLFRRNKVNMSHSSDRKMKKLIVCVLE